MGCRDDRLRYFSSLCCQICTPMVPAGPVAWPVCAFASNSHRGDEAAVLESKGNKSLSFLLTSRIPTRSASTSDSIFVLSLFLSISLPSTCTLERFSALTYLADLKGGPPEHSAGIVFSPIRTARRCLQLTRSLPDTSFASAPDHRQTVAESG